MELAIRQVPPDSLTAVPVEPDGSEEEDEEYRAAYASQITKQAAEGSGVDFFTRGVEVS